MCTEEAVAAAYLCGQRGIVAQVVPLQAAAHPVRVALVVAVAVGQVVHDLAIEYASRLVDLPEDDAAVAAAAQAVALCCPLHLLSGQIAAVHHCLAKVALVRQAPLPHRPQILRSVLPQLISQGLKRIAENFVKHHFNLWSLRSKS